MNEPIRVERRKVLGRVADSDGLSARQHIEQALEGLQYGTLTIVVQDGVIVQIERTERTRFGRG